MLFIIADAFMIIWILIYFLGVYDYNNEAIGEDTDLSAMVDTNKNVKWFKSTYIESECIDTVIEISIWVYFSLVVKKYADTYD